MVAGLQNDIIDVTPVAIMPSEPETAERAVARQLATYKAINLLVDASFEPGIDSDVIEGTSKPTLLLPGIEKVMGLLGLREEYTDIHVERNFNPDEPFFFYEVEAVIYHTQTGHEVARGQGVCHTREKSFLKRQERTCPNCEKETIKRSKPEYGGGWYCWKKIDGCGATFDKDDERITSQNVGNVFDPQLVWDGINRARKIANKRALASAIKRIGMLSGKFTVDLEDFAPTGNHPQLEQPKRTESKVDANKPVDNPQPPNNVIDGTAALQPQPDEEPTRATHVGERRIQHWSRDKERAEKFLEYCVTQGLGETNKEAWEYLAAHYNTDGTALTRVSDIQDEADTAQKRVEALAEALKADPAPTTEVDSALPFHESASDKIVKGIWAGAKLHTGLEDNAELAKHFGAGEIPADTDAQRNGIVRDWLAFNMLESQDAAMKAVEKFPKG